MASASFPVSFNDPADADKTWFFDEVHTPQALTPLSFDLYSGPFIEGYGYMRPIYVNYYVFRSGHLYGSGGIDANEEDIARIYMYIDDWESTVLDEIKTHYKYYTTTDFDRMSAADLIQELLLLRERRIRQGSLHTRAIRPYVTAMNLLVRECKALLGIDDVAALGLVRGHANKSTELAQQLWVISRLVKRDFVLRQLLQQLKNRTWADARDQLTITAAAEKFGRIFSNFLDVFGWRSESFEMAQSTWAEEPQVPIELILAYAKSAGPSPLEQQQSTAARRNLEVQEALEKLNSADRSRLQAVLDLASRAVSIQEDHNYFLDQKAGTAPRRLILSAATQLESRGAIEAKPDIFYLRASEVIEALGDDRLDLQGLIEMRRTEYAAWASVSPPRYIGAAPSSPTTKHSPALGDKPAWLSGIGASNGTTRGRARLIRTLDDASALAPGDILVVRTTTPTWSPLFRTVSAVVTEAGGPLSHAAIMIRECAIPGAVGVAGAMTLIDDGQMIEVDGASGRVSILL